MIKATFSIKQMVESTVQERVNWLVEAGMKVSCRGDSVRVEEGCLETVISQDQCQVQFIWYPPDEEVPK